MSFCHLEQSIDDCMKSCLTGPTTKGPVPRWQRKKSDKSAPLSPIDMNASKGNGKSKTPNGSKSFNKSLNTSRRTNKTPRKTPGKTTPKIGNKSMNNETSYDRFIPNRALMDVNRCHHLLMKGDTNSKDGEEKSPSKADYEQCIRENFANCESSSKILTMSSKAPKPSTRDNANTGNVLYSQNRAKGPRAKSSRHIPSAPERILDAPDMVDDYYLNLLDWGSNNCISVALDGAVFVWNAGSGDVTKLLQLDDNEMICSVKWIGVGNILAVGLSNGVVELWDTDQEKRIRSMSGHAARVSSLSWNAHILSSGSRSSSIHHHDVRVSEHHVGTLAGHCQEVCGLQWSPDGNNLASGGNDNIVNVWDSRTQSQDTELAPLQSFSLHMAAVKAVSWCPWKSHVLATGGGTADRHVHVWNVNSGVCLQSLDTSSQVSGILWSEEHKEIITGHGFAHNQLSIWKFPSMEKVTDLTGHSSRVLNLAQSPDKTMIASAAADETLRLWKCFAVDKKKEISKFKRENKLDVNSMKGLLR